MNDGTLFLATRTLFPRVVATVGKVIAHASCQTSLPVAAVWAASRSGACRPPSPPPYPLRAI